MFARSLEKFFSIVTTLSPNSRDIYQVQHTQLVNKVKNPGKRKLCHIFLSISTIQSKSGDIWNRNSPFSSSKITRKITEHQTVTYFERQMTVICATFFYVLTYWALRGNTLQYLASTSRGRVETLCALKQNFLVPLSSDPRRVWSSLECLT